MTSPQLDDKGRQIWGYRNMNCLSERNQKFLSEAQISLTNVFPPSQALLFYPTVTEQQSLFKLLVWQ